MHGGIRSFFEPAAKSCKRGPHKQQPSLGTGDVAIAAGAADEAVTANTAPLGVQQFARKRKRYVVL
jgi:hypothetical protein